MATRLEDGAGPPSIRRMGPRQMAMIKGLFLIAGVLSFILSVVLWFAVDREQGLFVGIWVPSMWSLGALLLAGERVDT